MAASPHFDFAHYELNVTEYHNRRTEYTLSDVLAPLPADLAKLENKYHSHLGSVDGTRIRWED